MGCDIHIWAERRDADRFEVVRDVTFTGGSAPFDWRSYAMFGFLAGVRNYSAITPLSEPRGLPADASVDAREGLEGTHSESWLGVDELLKCDYNSLIEDRRTTKQLGPNLRTGAHATESGEGSKMTLREFLGQAFFDDLKSLESCGAERIVFGFDS